MNFFIKFLTLISISYFCGCTSTVDKVKNSDPQNYTLHIEVVGEEIGHAVLFGFWGDQQIRVDSLPIINGTIVYPISSKCNKGVYRIFLNNYGFDFVYNEENVKIQIDPTNPNRFLNAIESEENKVFFSFQNDLNSGSLNRDSSNSCDLFTSLKMKYAKRGNTEMYAYHIIDFILNSNIDCYANQDISKQQIISLMDSMRLGEHLLASPYFVSQIMELVKSSESFNSQQLAALITALSQKSEPSQILAHFITVALWKSGVETGNKNYIKHLFASPDCMEDSLLGNGSIFDIGETIEEDLDSLSGNQGFQEYIYVINNSKCAIPGKEWRAFERSISLENKRKVLRYDISNLPDDLKKKYNIYGSPMILIADNEKRLISRWVGFHECNNLILR